jgi:D-alanyl-D-alanine carboxypeptidase
MKSFFASALIIFSAWGSAAAAAQTDVETRLQAAIDGFAAERIDGRQAPGLAVGVARGGEVLFIGGYGEADLEGAAPVTGETVFRIGSVTKQFTAAALLLLEEEGRLSLDDPLSAFFPDFPRADEVTVRQLLNHTSGIRNYTALDDFGPRASAIDHDGEAMVAYIAAADPLYDFEPGAGWRYSNSGYMLLGLLVEQVTGEPLGEHLRERLFDPLGMDDTRMDDGREIVPGRARGYDADEAAPTGFVNTAHISPSVAAGAGAMRSTPADLLVWTDALLGGRVLSAESLDAMLAPGTLSDGRPASSVRTEPEGGGPVSDYGLGIMTGERDGRRTIGHGGSINGFNASLIHYPDEQVTITLLVNTIGPASTGAPALADAVFDVLDASAPQ